MCATCSSGPACSAGATHVMEHAEYGYTTNIPLADITTDEAIVAYAFEGEEIEPIHGGPVRIVVPHLYFWKSAKWVRALGAARQRRARLLGAQRLPHVRRPVHRATPLGRLRHYARIGRFVERRRPEELDSARVLFR